MAKLKSKLDVQLILIVVIAAFLNGYNIWSDRYANTYYTTAVASMLKNFHNFFFGSLDSAGSVTIDKPPLTFWIQTFSAYIFGLHGWSVILPQALAGVGSVLLIYFLVKPTFGLTAARLGALGFALTPVVAVVSRTNNIDSMLVFTLLIATWLLFRSIKKNSFWSLLSSFAVIGLAFNMKMLQAYMVLPGYYIFFLMAAKYNWKKKFALLAGATVLMVAISLSWAVVVDSMPKSERPYIGSSQTNSVLELAFGYNGISRLTGNQGPGVGQNNSKNQEQKSNHSINPSTKTNGDTQGDPRFGENGGNPPNGGTSGGNFGGPTGSQGGGNAQGMFGTGAKGPLRLFQSGLSGQASWILPFIIFAFIGLLADIRRKNITLKQQETFFWLAWLLPAAVFFSVAGFFHQYYLIMLAPPIAAIFGMGAVKLVEDYRNNTGWKSWLLPIAVILTTALQWYIIHPYEATIGSGLSNGVIVTGMAFSIVLILFKSREKGLKYNTTVAGLLVMLIGPLYWASTPITFGENSMTPQAGPSAGDGMGGMGGPPGRAMTAFNAQAGGPNGNSSTQNSQNQTIVNNQPQPNNSPLLSNLGRKQGGMNREALDQKTLKYLKEHNTGEKYLFATTSYQTAAPYIIDKGELVITMGGFSGNDPVYSVAKIKELVSSGKVKFFLISNRGGMGGQSSAIITWIEQHGEKIPSTKWQSKTLNNSHVGQGGPGGSNVLYDVK
jgi:4-amino-4-deoxy-L-arabinose transferase-like glycosyltransferase